MKASAFLVVALALAGCGPIPAHEVEIACGPLGPAACREQAEMARRFVETRYEPETVRRLEFVDAAGGYTITFADGTQAGVSP